MRINQDHSVEAVVQELTHNAKSAPAGYGACRDLPLSVLLLELLGSFYDIV